MLLFVLSVAFSLLFSFVCSLAEATLLSVSPSRVEQLVRTGRRVGHLLRRFKQATGETPIGYLQQLRIDAAKRLLETSSLNVDQIMAAVGYEDRASFGQLFKTLAACSPQQYRLRARPG